VELAATTWQMAAREEVHGQGRLCDRRSTRFRWKGGDSSPPEIRRSETASIAQTYPQHVVEFTALARRLSPPNRDRTLRRVHRDSLACRLELGCQCLPGGSRRKPLKTHSWSVQRVSIICTTKPAPRPTSYSTMLPSRNAHKISGISNFDFSTRQNSELFQFASAPQFLRTMPAAPPREAHSKSAHAAGEDSGGKSEVKVI
jgi:hypothetical protein